MTIQNSTENLEAKKLQSFPQTHSRTQSLTEVSEYETIGPYDIERLQSCPPNLDASRESLVFIDKTPSKDSLAIPYCPPVQMDYEDFPNLFDPWSIIVTDESLNDHPASNLVILPTDSIYDRPIPSPIIPLIRNEPRNDPQSNLPHFVSSQHLTVENQFTASNEIQHFRDQPIFTSEHEIHIKPKPKPNPKPNFCVEVRMKVSPPPPETPDLIRNLKPNREKRISLKCKPSYTCFSRTLSSDDEYEPLHKDLECQDTGHELPMSSLSKDDSVDDSQNRPCHQFGTLI